MNEQMFWQQVNKEDFEKVVRYLHNAYDPTDYKRSRILREQLIVDVFGEYGSKEDFDQKRHLLETIARASKTKWGQKLYEQVTGSRGFIQATAVNKKSYYEAVVGKNLEKYNPRTYADILKLVERAIPYIVQNPNMSAEEVASRLSQEYGYVVGSILPSVGTIRAFFNRRVQDLAEVLSEAVQMEKNAIFANDKAKFLETVGRLFDECIVEYTPEDVAKVVSDKLRNKNSAK